MRIHREGTGTLLIVGFILAGLDFIFCTYLPAWMYYILVPASIIFYGFFVQFFRNPNRILTIDDNAVISPADGTVCVIEKVFEPEYLKTDCMQVSIFMSPLNVHLNRVPISGTLEYYKYHPGKYLVAFHPKSSLLNERNTTVIIHKSGKKLLMRQIAGAVARRICYYLKEGEQVQQGFELGFIKFGSRCDIFLPLDADIKVVMDQETKGGQTVIARW